MASHFHSQVDTLVQRGYPKQLRIAEKEFRDALEPLVRSLPPSAEVPLDPSEGKLPFVLVVRSTQVTVDKALPLVSRRGMAAIERLDPKRPQDFVPIESVSLPQAHAYLMMEVDRGAATLNVTPDDAFRSIAREGRSPLTIEEGVAVLMQFPEFLQPNHCFSLLGSRCGDKRVPALWLSEGRPKLGWCWAGNPHTWLGSASCAGRVSPPAPAPGSCA